MLLGLQLNRPMGKSSNVKRLQASDTSLRSKFSRSLVYSLNIQSGDRVNQQHVLTNESPLQITRQFSGSSLSSVWVMTTAANAEVHFPNLDAILIHMEDQRPFVKCAYTGDSLEEKSGFYVNLSKCKYRDRFIVENGMTVVVMDSSTSRRCEIEFCILNDSGEEVSRSCGGQKADSDNEQDDDSGDDSHESEDRTVGVEGEASNSPRFKMESAKGQCGCTAVPKQSALRTGRTVLRREKSITWHASVQTLPTKTKAADPSSPIFVKIRIDGEEKMTLTSEERFMMFGGLCLPSNFPMDKVIQLPLSTATGIIFGVSIHDDRAFLTLPRLRPNDQDHVQVLLALPSQIDYPIGEGDVLEFFSDKQGTTPLELRVDMKQLMRKPPLDDQIRTCEYNPAHAISEFATEIIYQGNNGDSDGEDGTGKVYVIHKNHFANAEVRIGRTACDINIADRHVSRHHATIERREGIFFLCRAESVRKAIYLLLGKKNSHHRPPMSLRTGDEFRVGRSDFKIVYQQRGVRTINQTSQEEMISRMHVFSRPSNELKRRECQIQETSEDGKALLQSFGLDAQEKEPLMILMKLRGSDMGKYFLCHPSETTIGSDETANISVPTDRMISPLHARVFFDMTRERWVLQDLQSARGTFMKFDRSDPPLLLAIGDVLMMGSTCVRILGKSIMPSSFVRRSHGALISSHG